jgi:hypothetical protein
MYKSYGFIKKLESKIGEEESRGTHRVHLVIQGRYRNENRPPIAKR